MAVERYQNPNIDDTINLRLFTYNSNKLKDVQDIQKIEIFHLDPAEVSTDNTNGERLVETITAATNTETGTYLIAVALDCAEYVVGDYIDRWTIAFGEGDAGECRIATIDNHFKIVPDLWYTTPIPVVYDFNFRFTPNRFRKGEKKHIAVEIVPNVPRASDLARYYENLAIVSDLKVSLELACGDCLPAEADLRLVVDCESVDFREKCFGYYQLDTTDLACGVYNIWFTMEFGENVYVSDKTALEIYD